MSGWQGSLHEVFLLCVKPLKLVTAIYSLSECKAHFPEVSVCDQWLEVPIARGCGAENGADVPGGMVFGVCLA